MIKQLGNLKGKVLDVGCGNKPYKKYLSVDEYVGCDIQPLEGVDVLIKDGNTIEWEGDYFDACFCAQVFEHVEKPELLLKEITRCLKKGAKLIITHPFIYNEHSSPHDYRRLSRFGLRSFLEKYYFIEEIKIQGGIGSTLGILFLNWVNVYLASRNRIIAAVFIPIWMLVSPMINIIGFILDAIDGTGSFYNNAIVVAKKK